MQTIYFNSCKAYYKRTEIPDFYLPNPLFPNTPYQGEVRKSCQIMAMAGRIMMNGVVFSPKETDTAVTRLSA